MIAHLKAALAAARALYFKLRAKRRAAKPGGDRREKLAAQQRAAEADKKALAKKLAAARKRHRVVATPGAPHWGGGDDIIRAECDPVAAHYGAPVTSRKRSASDPLSLSNPGSDHNEANTTASAADYGTFSGAPLAHAIANALGISGYSTGNYNAYYIKRAGHRYRVQILWAVEGHFDHCHVGIKLA